MTDRIVETESATPEKTLRELAAEHVQSLKVAPEKMLRELAAEHVQSLKVAPEKTLREMLQEQLRALKVAPEKSLRETSFLSRLSPEIADQLRAVKMAPERSLREISYLSRLSPEMTDQLRAVKVAPEKTLRELAQEQLRAVMAPKPLLREMLQEQLRALKRAPEKSLRETSFLSRLSPEMADQLRAVKMAPEKSLREISYLSRLSPEMADQLRAVKMAPEKTLRELMTEQVQTLRGVRRQVESEQDTALEKAAKLGDILPCQPTTRELLFAVWDGDEFLPEREFLQTEIDKRAGFDQLDISEQIAQLQEIVLANGSPRFSTYCVALVINWLSQCFTVQNQVLMFFVASLVFAWDYCTARQRVAQARKLCEAGGIEARRNRIIARDCDVFDSPGHKRKRMRTIAAGVIVEVAEKMGGWRQVIFFEDEVGHLRVGWVRSKYLRRV